jgi:hypothetical protein
MIQVMVAYAPDDALLGYVAAGPVEDLMGGKFLQLMREEAQANPRFRIALGMTNRLHNELEPFADRDREGKRLPPVQPLALTPDEIELMTAYFHLGDTSWASSLFSELNRGNPAEALFMLQLLLDHVERTPHLREEVFVHAVNPFIHVNFATYKSELKALAVSNKALREWFLESKRPWTSDLKGWVAFVRELVDHAEKPSEN